MTWRNSVARHLVYPSLQGIAASPGLSRIADTICARYGEMRRGYSYEFEKNGEAKLVQACIRAVREPTECFTFFDVGANEGAWTRFVLTNARSIQISGHIFEVSAEMTGHLVDEFGLVEGLNLNHCALSNRSGTVEFKRFPHAEIVNTLLVESPFWDDLEHVTETAPAQTGDEYCRMRGISKIDFLKIDVEGWEWNVLEGFHEMLTQNRVGVVQFEYGYMSADLGPLMRSFFQLFEGMGYVVGPLRPWGVDFRPFRYTDNDFTSGPNYVAALPGQIPNLRQF